MYNAVNFNLTRYNIENITIAGVKLSILNCPSDITDAQPIQAAKVGNATTLGWSYGYDVIPTNPVYNQTFTSYGGNTGTWVSKYYIGIANASTLLAQMNGVIYNESAVTIAQVTDGTSNTFLFGERSKYLIQKYDPAYAISDGSWNTGQYYDTMVCTLYPPNVGSAGGIPGGFNAYSYYAPAMASSLHPGGLNMAFCDGSVRFIKNTISSWTFGQGNTDQYQDAVPDNVSFNASTFVFTNNGARLGVYQALSTRNGAEVLSSDSF
jgi:prepilin-type processing-associated H-X9-DG protein